MLHLAAATMHFDNVLGALKSGASTNTNVCTKMFPVRLPAYWVVIATALSAHVCYLPDVPSTGLR